MYRTLFPHITGLSLFSKGANLTQDKSHQDHLHRSTRYAVGIGRFQAALHTTTIYEKI